MSILQYTRSKLEFAERSVPIRGSITFNNVPEHVRVQTTLSSFKANLLDSFNTNSNVINHDCIYVY